MSNFENITPPTSAFIDSDNNVQDIQAVLESGAVVVTAVAPGPVVPIGTATTPKFENIAPWVGKFVNPDNDIIDLMDLLTSGAIQVQVSGGGGGGAPTTATYITQVNEALLPNSVPLSGLSTGFLASETATGVLTARTLTGAANQLVVANGDGSANPTFSISPTLVLPGTITLGGNLVTAGFSLTQASGSMSLTAPVSIDLITSFTSVNALRHYGEATNKINFTTGAQDFLPDNFLQLRLNASGITLKNGVPVNNISDDDTFALNSDSVISTQKATKTYIAATETIIKAATYLTQADETAMLPNSTSMAGLPDGFAMVFGGLLGTQLLTGTTNQITVVGGDASSTAAVFSLPSTLVTPGTLDVGTTFSIGATGSITSITNNPASVSANAFMDAATIQAAIAAAIVAGTSFRGGWDASGGLYPTTGGSGILGAVAAGDWWYITVAGTLNTTPVVPGDQIFALVATPGQTDANWLAVGVHVTSVFSRTGDIVATSGDYSFSLISGTAAVGQGGTGLTSAGTSGNVLTSNGSVWTSAAPAVASVFGRTGAVVAATNDYSFAQISGTASPAQGGTGLTSPGASGNVLSSDGAGNWVSSVPPSAPVSSVFGRTGAVVATSGDYSFSLISGTAVETQGGTGQTTYATGDLLHASAANTLSKLTIGSSGQVLTVSAGDVAWATPATVPVTQSYITKTDETATLANSIPLSGLATGFLANTTTTGVLTSRTLTGTSNEIVVTNGDGSGVPTFSLSSTLVTPGTITLGGDMDVLARKITSSTGVVNITPLEGFRCEVDATNLSIRGAINKMSETGNKIVLGSSIQAFQPTGSTTRFEIAATGIRVFTGVTVSDFSNDTTMADDSATSLVTEHAVKTYVDTSVAAISLTNAGTTSLVNDGTGPALALKGLVAGAGMAPFGTSATDVTINLTVPVTIANGGTNATAAIGASGTIAQSDGTKYTFTTATYPATAGSAGTLLRSNATNFVNSTSTFADTYAASSLLYSNGANTVAGLATANSAMLVTSSTGVPVMSGTMTNGQVIIGSTGATPTAATLTEGTNIAITNGAASITVGLTGTVAIANGGTSFTTYATGDTLYASASNTLSKLTIGSTGDVLTVAGGVPTWAAPSGGAGSTGYIWMNTGNWTGVSFAFTTAYQELTSLGTNFALAADSTDFAMTTDGRLKYTGATTKNMVVSFVVILSNGSGNYAAQLYKNGSAVTGSEIYVPNNGNPTLQLFPVDSVATNDYFSIFIKRSANSSQTIVSIGLGAHSI